MSQKSKQGLKLVSEVLVVIFFASAVLQFNDENLAIWGTFYSFHAVFAASSIFKFGSQPFGLAMGAWSVVMVVLSLLELRDSAVTAMEELAGAALGLVSTAYHISLMG